MKIELLMSERDARTFTGWLAHCDPAESIRLSRLDDIAAQITARLPKPRILAPSKWGVVAAFTRDHETTSRHFVNWGGTWVSSLGNAYSWDDLVDPVLIREGI